MTDKKPDRPPRRKPESGKPRRHVERRNPSGWDAVADWYDGWVGKGGSIHHRKVAIPAVMELLDVKKGESVLDIGAGQGVLAPDVAKAGASYTGVDVSIKLLSYARQHHGKHGRFLHADAARLLDNPDLKRGSFDAAVFLLSIQDMDPLDAVLNSASLMLKPGGRIVLLMTHPAFRIPRQSGWGFDENRKLQYRRVDRYLSPLPVPMKPHENSDTGVTISFHRAIGDYVNALSGVGLWVDQLRELPIGEHSMKQDRTKAEKLADAEIPLFLGIRARKVSGP